MSYITHIETAVPEFCHNTQAVSTFFQNSTEDPENKRKIKVINSKSAIETRYSVIEDFSLQPENFRFFAKSATLEPQPNLSRRMSLFKTEAIALSLKAIKKIKNFEVIKNTITHIITVTCTGLFAPGLDIEIIRELGLSSNIQRSSINFMGCNAAILALKSADAICTSTAKSRVLVVCTELCTIHFQKNYSDDYILSTALFGDGCAAVLVDSDAPVSPSFHGLKINSFNSQLIHQGFNEMAWSLSETGFIMNLSAYVSGLINGSMKDLLASISLDPDSVNHWAIHPGGKKILDDFAKTLKLTKSDLKESYEVLNDYGNMSSATVLFVLKKIMENTPATQTGDTVFSAAFGPGLSIETMQLEYV